MPARLHPGVYVEEVPSGARSIEGVGTSTTIFVGDAERGPLEPTMIKGIADYERAFGGYRRVGPNTPRCRLRHAMDAFFSNGGTTAYILRAVENGITPAYGIRADTGGQAHIRASSPGAWSQSLGIVFGESSDNINTHFRIFVTYTAPGAAAATVVETFDRLSFDPASEGFVVDVLQRSLYIRWDPAFAVPAPATLVAREAAVAGNLNPIASVITAAAVALAGGTGGAAAIDPGDYDAALYGRLDEVTDASLLVVVPFDGAQDNQVLAIQSTAIQYAVGRPRQDLFAIADMPRTGAATATDATSATKAFFLNAVLTKDNFGAVYFPWVEVSDPIGVGRDPTIVLGPAPFVAGLYARNDQRRGVWKAPAGLEATLLGVRKIEFKLLDTHQDELNPLGVNALRPMPQGGNVVWGSRTMEPSSEWRYIPVRRTAIFLRSSIYNGIQWAVFEPNNHELWNNLRLTIGSFMDQLFRQGAFAGRTAREAYFVKCDEETTPEADQIAGIVNVWVGFAPLRPAEFVVVQLRQMVAQRA
jgi:phage tail sheath protein FI